MIWTVFAFVGRYTKALAVPSWVPPLSLTSIALAFGDDSDYLEDEDLEVNEALRRLAHGGHDDSEDDRLPGMFIVLSFIPLLCRTELTTSTTAKLPHKY